MTDPQNETTNTLPAGNGTPEPGEAAPLLAPEAVPDAAGQAQPPEASAVAAEPVAAQGADSTGSDAGDTGADHGAKADDPGSELADKADLAETPQTPEAAETAVTADAADHSSGETEAESADVAETDAAEEAGAESAAGTPADGAAPKPRELSPAQCGAKLAELFPALFGPEGPRKPIKLRIQADLNERAPGVFTKRVLGFFLSRYTTTTAYLRALSTSPTRFDLDGQPAGEIAEEHKAAAVVELERRRELHEARRAAERAAARYNVSQAEILLELGRRQVVGGPQRDHCTRDDLGVERCSPTRHCCLSEM